MHPIRKRRLYGLLALLTLLGLISMLVLYAMRQNISLFYTPTQIFEKKPPVNTRIRVGGMVVEQSISHQKDQTHFRITDFSHQIEIEYTGILPDLFREKQGVVINGYLTTSGRIFATEVLAKHDAKYMPPEIKHLAEKRNERVE